MTNALTPDSLNSLVSPILAAITQETADGYITDSTKKTSCTMKRRTST